MSSPLSFAMTGKRKRSATQDELTGECDIESGVPRSTMTSTSALAPAAIPIARPVPVPIGGVGEGGGEGGGASESNHQVEGVSFAMTGKRKRSAAQDELTGECDFESGAPRGAMTSTSAPAAIPIASSSWIFSRKGGSRGAVAVSRVLEHFTGDDLASVLPMMYQTCTCWRDELEHPHEDVQKRTGFHLRTFSLCRVLAHKMGVATLHWVQATIVRQTGRLSDQDDERGWWLDARSLVQRWNFRVGSWTVWSLLQAASQEPDGPLSRQAAATARLLGWRLVCWPDKPHARFPLLCTLRGHSGWVRSVAYSPDGKHVASASGDKTVKIWDSTTGKEVSVLVCDCPIVCCCVHCC